MNNENLFDYLLHLGDNSMILGHRLSELCGHGPTLETDIALTNMSLDLFGQVRNYFQYAAKIKGGETTEDSIAMLRVDREFRNVWLVEQPDTDFAYTITRQFLFDSYHLLLLEKLVNSSDETIAAIANKSIKEVRYHLRFSANWMKRLGDGTSESNQKMQAALDELFVFTEELFNPSQTEIEAEKQGYGVNPETLKIAYYENVNEVLNQANLQVPDFHSRILRGKQGIHSEKMGFILADLQYMQRAYPNMEW